jgi:hypothetical protein
VDEEVDKVQRIKQMAVHDSWKVTVQSPMDSL